MYYFIHIIEDIESDFMVEKYLSYSNREEVFQLSSFRKAYIFAESYLWPIINSELIDNYMTEADKNKYHNSKLLKYLSNKKYNIIPYNQRKDKYAELRRFMIYRGT